MVSIARTFVTVIFLLAVSNAPAIATITSLTAPTTNLVAMDEEVLWISTGMAVLLAAMVAMLMISEWFRKVAGWVLIFLAAGLVCVTALILAGPFGLLLLVNALMFIALMVSCSLTSRYAAAAYVISTIAASIRQNLPLPMALESAAGDEKDKRATILRQIQMWLVRGYSLADSIRMGFPKCPTSALTMIAAAERIDQLPNALDAIVTDMAIQADERKRMKPASLFTYPLTLLMVTLLIILLLTWKVFPKFYIVLQEMVPNGSLPVSTRILINATRLTYTTALGPILPAAVLMITLFYVWARLRPRRIHDPHLSSIIGDHIKWHLPILRWFDKNYALVQTTELLRLSLNAGCPLDQAIANVLDLDLNINFRRQLQRWLNQIRSGRDISTAIKECRLTPSLAWAFDENVNRGNTIQVLQTLEDFHRMNYNYAARLVAFITEPCLTIAMGLFVGFVVYAMYSPLIATIHYTAANVTP